MKIKSLKWSPHHSQEPLQRPASGHRQSHGNSKNHWQPDGDGLVSSV